MPIVLFEPTEVLFDELEEEVVGLDLADFAGALDLLLLFPVGHDHDGDLAEAGHELLEVQPLPRIDVNMVDHQR